MMSRSVADAHPASAPWSIRAVQLDLARQRETLPTIRQFIRFAAEWGYNTLLLYLEGVVRTPTFPFRDPTRTYNLDEMRQVVAWADEAGLIVIPCVGTLGHAEHFVQCPELAHLRETGRSFPGGHMFCPSLPETHTFLDAYLTELAQVFPAPHFHLGCDEAWHLGACPRCRASSRSHADLFCDHLQHYHNLLARLGKRAWIWDDMFELIGEEPLASLPRDIVLCHWHYSADAMDFSGVRGHFNRRHRRDWLTVYEQLGFDVLICPSARSSSNVLAFNRCARRRRVLGGLQTIWEMGADFLPSVLPNVALTGFTWSHPEVDDETAMRKVVDQLIPRLPEPASLAVRRLMDTSLFHRTIHPELLLQGPMGTRQKQELLAARIDRALLADAARKADDASTKAILEELNVLARERVVMGTLREALPWVVDPRVDRVERDRFSASAEACLAELRALAEIRAARWATQREGLEPNTASLVYRKLHDHLLPLLDAPSLRSGALLELRLYLDEAHSAARLRIDLRHGDAWRPLLPDCVFKPMDLNQSLFTVQVPLALKPVRHLTLRCTVTGYGGQGIAHVALHWAGHSLVPTEAHAVRGLVANPQAVLQDDASHCMLGARDTLGTLLRFEEDQPSILELAMGQAPSEQARRDQQARLAGAAT